MTKFFLDSLGGLSLGFNKVPLPLGEGFRVGRSVTKKTLSCVTSVIHFRRDVGLPLYEVVDRPDFVMLTSDGIETELGLGSDTASPLGASRCPYRFR